MEGKTDSRFDRRKLFTGAAALAGGAVERKLGSTQARHPQVAGLYPVGVTGKAGAAFARRFGYPPGRLRARRV